MRGMGANYPTHPADLQLFGAVCRRPDSRLRNRGDRQLKLEPEIRARLERRWSANPGRAARMGNMEVRGTTHPNLFGQIYLL